MDPCQFVRIRVGNLALKLPTPPTSTSSSTTSLTTLRHPTTTSSSPSTSSSSSAPFYYCKIKFANFAPQTTTLALAPSDAASGAAVSSAGSTAAACFSLSKPDLDKLIAAEKKKNKKKAGKQQSSELSLKIDVYFGKGGDGVTTGCFFSGSGRKFMGRVCVSLSDLDRQERTGSVHNGWVKLDAGQGKKIKTSSQLYVSVKAEPDPRFVFEFGGEPECSPQVFQVQGCIRQPVFTCKFGFKNSSDWGNNGRSYSSSGSDANERKGWTVTIHDLSGSPIAAASMVTPFVPSPGTDRVSRSNPGSWLILRPGDGTWKPWGRLEAWRERSASGGYSLGHRFEIIPDPTPINGGGGGGSGLSPAGSGGITLSNGSEISTEKGGKFAIDIGSYNSPVTSPSSSFDLGSWNGSGGSGSSEGGGMWWWPQFMYRGFVMSATVGGEKEKKPEVVEVGVQHVNCAEDAAVFVALAAAMNLSMDACMPFSTKLRKELRHQRSGEMDV